jgi:hypothetical protein
MEKNLWEAARWDLLIEKQDCGDTPVALNKLLREKKDTAIVVWINSVQERRIALMRKIEDTDIGYIVRHPGSYFSGYLLYQHRRVLCTAGQRAGAEAAAG